MEMETEEIQKSGCVRVPLLAISDLHLGSELCKAQTIEAILSYFEPQELVLVGDIFDDLNLKRLKRSHFDVLKRISGLAKRGCNVNWIRGNHDEDLADVFAAFVGADVLDEYVWRWNHKKVIFIHGDQFDTFMEEFPWASAIFTDIYWWFQYSLGLIGLDRLADRVCRFCKRHAKGYTRAKRNVADGALEYARLKSAQHIICGHTHQKEDRFWKGRHYHNTGCGTEIPVTCITFTDTEIRRHHFDDEGKEVNIEILPQ